MLYNIFSQFVDQFSFLNVFRYITFRTGGAMLTALIVSFVCGPYIIRLLKSHQEVGQPIRKDGPEGHNLSKVGTPTMGGFMILLALVVSTLLWADLSNIYIQSVTIEPSEGCTTLDVNNDGLINVIDVVQTVNLVLGDTPPTEWESCAADGNSDGIINVLDVVLLVNYILS